MNLNRGRFKFLFSLLPISMIVLAILSVTKSVPKDYIEVQPQLHIQKHSQIAHLTCEGTLYPELCVSTILSFPDLATKTLPGFISATLNQTVSEVRQSSSNCSVIKKKLQTRLDAIENVALNDCLELLDDTVSELKSALSDLSSTKATAKHYHDLQTLLSAAMTNQYTCLDGFAHSKGSVRKKIMKRLVNISRHVSNSLAMLKKVPGVNKTKSEVFPEYGEVKNGFPTWLSLKDRKLLQAPVNTTKFNRTVAKDGSGDFTNISDAVAAAPNSSTTRFVIHIKAGAYFENVEVEKKKTNLVFIGDGIGKTVIKASRNVVEGWTTFRSATVGFMKESVGTLNPHLPPNIFDESWNRVLQQCCRKTAVGKGFIAKGITFENAAGPRKHQAVAFRSGSDLSAFYQCSFVGYQDTLYVHSLRQFYRECDIYGTIDFIFGNAAVVFQNCNLYAREPNENQKNIFTAQGREDPNQNTGISILNSKIAATSDLIPFKSSFKTYLGRPWKEYSRTVILRSYIDDLIEPAGWLEWNGSFALSTLYYGEYMNRGPGSNTTGRVKWPGYRVINSSTEASQFTVENFIQGSEWLNSTGIPYFLNVS